MLIIYIENAVKNHPTTKRIITQLNTNQIIIIEKYSDIFNRKKQDFRYQKELGHSIILAEKKQNFLMVNPDYCASNLPFNFYFSTTLNCLFDCEYCFLQGMYSSAYPVIFVNTNDFKTAITKQIKNIDQNFTTPEVRTMFFSAYDNDSLGLNHLSQFTDDFIPWFSQFNTANLEIRTKSANTDFCYRIKPTNNTIITWTLSPAIVQNQWEHRTASLEARVKALNLVKSQGFKVAIRLDPIIYLPNWQTIYQDFFDYLAKNINFNQIDNIWGGFFKMPIPFLKKTQKMYPKSSLLQQNFYKDKDQTMTYSLEIRQTMQDFFKNACSKLGHKLIISTN